MDFNFSLRWHGNGCIRHSNTCFCINGILFSLLRGIWVFIILYTIYWTMECFTLYLIQVNLSFIGQSNPNQVFKWISVSYDSFLFKICQPLKNIVKKKNYFFQPISRMFAILWRTDWSGWDVQLPQLREHTIPFTEPRVRKT